MARAVILSSASERVEIEAGESADVVATLYDTSGAALAKAAIATLTATLQHITAAGVVTTINSRSAQDILDTNGGAVTTAGVLTLKLQPLDNVAVDATYGNVESHYLTIAWTWVDADTVTRTGKQEFEFYVRPLPS